MRRFVRAAAAILVVGMGGCAGGVPRTQSGTTAPSTSAITSPAGAPDRAAAVPLGQWAPVGPHVRLRIVSFAPMTDVSALRQLGLGVDEDDLEWLVVRMELDNATSAKWDVASLGPKLVDPLGMALVDPDDEGAPGTRTTLVSATGEARFGVPGATTAITLAFGVPKGTSAEHARLSVSTAAVTGEYFALH